MFFLRKMFYFWKKFYIKKKKLLTNSHSGPWKRFTHWIVSADCRTTCGCGGGWKFSGTCSWWWLFWWLLWSLVSVDGSDSINGARSSIFSGSGSGGGTTSTFSSKFLFRSWFLINWFWVSVSFLSKCSRNNGRYFGIPGFVSWPWDFFFFEDFYQKIKKIIKILLTFHRWFVTVDDHCSQIWFDFDHRCCVTGICPEIGAVHDHCVIVAGVSVGNESFTAVIFNVVF